ncbi:MAG: hypothetical protein RLZZ303_2077 [Candidatus Hydrogenedentota bacterium]
MKTLTTQDFPSLSSALLSPLASGERYLSTHEDVPMAHIVGTQAAATEAGDSPKLSTGELTTRREALEHLREFRKTHSLGGLTYRERIDEGRKF